MKKIIEVWNNDGVLLKTYRSRKKLLYDEKISEATLSRCLNGHIKYPKNGRQYKYAGETQQNTNRVNSQSKRIAEYDLNGNLVKIYQSGMEVAKAKGISRGLVSHYLYNRAKPKGYTIKFYDEEETTEKSTTKDEIIKKETTMYYVNVLVGLVNGTLIDGSVFDFDGTKLTYVQEKESLEKNGCPFFTRNKMLQEIPIELPLLLPEEKSFLKTLLMAYEGAKGIIKSEDKLKPGYEFIRIEAKDEKDNTALPSFPQGKYYSQLRKDVLYSVEDLNLK